jgi:hypothetical protein
MQTFVPLTSSYEDIAQVLDNKRLNKQALEGWQILMNLLELDPRGNHRISKGWSNHPAVKMWKGHETALYLYVQAMVAEWKRRGFKSTIGEKAKETMLTAIKLGRLEGNLQTPPKWISDTNRFKEIASSHRAALLSKNYEWYSQFGWKEDTGIRPEEYEYIWPV